MKNIFIFLILCACSKEVAQNTGVSDPIDDTPVEVVLADIDFSNWKLTLPIDENNNGSPDEYQPDVLKNLGYQTLESILPYMYDDIEDSSIVFYTFPDVSTTNSSYSRTELRELINPIKRKR